MPSRAVVSLLLPCVFACGGDWSAHDAPATFGLSALWVFGPDDVWTGSQNMLHFDGDSFQEVDVPSEGAWIADMWALAPNALYAVAGTRLLHYDGTSWSLVDFGGAIRPDGLSAIWGFSKDDLWLGDSTNGQVHHFDGTTWRTMITQTVEVRDLWGSAPDDVYAVGIFGVSHWDGARWTEVQDDVVRSGDGVFGFSADDVWIVGGSHVMAHFDGSSWRDFTEELDVAMLDPSHDEVWGAASNDLWAVGDHGLISHWDGEEWSQDELGDRPHLAGVHGSGADEVWAVGTSGDGENAGLIFRHTR